MSTAAAATAGARRSTLCQVVQLNKHLQQQQQQQQPIQRRDTRLSLQSIQRLSLDGNSRRYARQRDSEEVINEILTKQHRRALRTLMMLVLLFLACRLPRTALALIDWSGVVTDEVHQRCSFYLELLVHLNGLLDPFAYVFCGNRLCHRRLGDYWRLVRERVAELAQRLGGRCRSSCERRCPGCCGCRCCCWTPQADYDDSQLDF